MNQDLLNSVNAKDAIQAAYAALSGVQGGRPADMVMGSAILAINIAKRCGLNVRELLAQAERVSKDADTHYNPEVRALNQFVDEQIINPK